MMADFVDFNNPAYEPDGWVEDSTMPELPEPPILTPSNTQQLGDHGDSLQNLRDELRVSELHEQKKRLVDAFYRIIGEDYGLSPTKIPYDQFTIDEDGKTIFWTPDGGNKIRVTAVKGGVLFRALASLAGDYGGGGTDAIRKSLELQEYTSKTRKGVPQKALSANGERALQQAVDTLPSGENVSLQDFSSVANDAIASAEMATTALHEELSSEQTAALATIDDPPLDVQWVGQARRELEGLKLAMTRKQDELVNNLAKLRELDDEIPEIKDHIAREHTKLTETDDEGLQAEIQSRITALERKLADRQLEREARLEAASINKQELRGQLSRIRETMTRVLEGDKTLAERIRTLFHEHGVTLVSILTAIGMAISTLVLALTGGGAAVTPPSPPPAPSGKGGLREWAKKMLHALGRILAKLAGKVAAALPGIIGSIVSWLLGTLGKAAGWLAEHMWALAVAAGGLLFLAAREFLAPHKIKRH